jgi:hypothetical protein
MTAEILKIEIPTEYKPTKGTDTTEYGIAEFAQKNVLYKGASNISTVFIAELGGGAHKPSRRELLDRFVNPDTEFQIGFGSGISELELNDEKTKTREFTISGQRVAFEFVSGNLRDGSGNQVRQVFGVFPCPKGDIVLTVVEDGADYNEARIVKMIELLGAKQAP